MNFLTDHDNIIKFLQCLNVITATWPLEPNANILKKIFYGILWCSYALNGITDISIINWYLPLSPRYRKYDEINSRIRIYM